MNNLPQTIQSTSSGVTYQLLSELGVGAQGIVCKAQIIQSNEIVAIKFQSQMSELEKQAMEYFVTKQFNHIINIRDFFQFQVFQVVVMDCADGQLYDLYNKAEFVNKSKQEKNQLFLQIIKGVEELHSLGLYHRDLKPENVVYFHQSNSYILKLCDFGLLKNTQDVFRTYNIGTPYYQAPELIDNNKAYNEKVDIWALGMMWFEMIAKKSMIDAFNKEQLHNQLKNLTSAQISTYIDGTGIFTQGEKLLLTNMLIIDPQQRPSITQIKHQLNFLAHSNFVSFQPQNKPPLQFQPNIIPLNQLAEVQRLNILVGKLELDNQSLKEKIQQLELQNQNIQQQNNQLTNQIFINQQIYNQEYQNLEQIKNQTLQQFQLKQQEIESRCQNQLQQIQQLEIQLEEKQQDYQNLMYDFSQLETQINQKFKDQIVKLERSINQNSQTYESSLNEKLLIMNKLETETKNEIESQRMLFQNQISDQKDQFLKEIYLKNAELQKLSAQINNQQQLQSENKSLTEKLSKIIFETNQKQDEILKHEKKIIDFQTQIKNIEQQKTDLLQELKDSQQRNKKLQEQLQEQQKQMKLTQHENLQENQQISKLNQEIKQQQQELQKTQLSYDQETKNLNQTIDDLKSEIKKLEQTKKLNFRIKYSFQNYEQNHNYQLDPSEYNENTAKS